MKRLLRLNQAYWPYLTLALLAIVTLASLAPRMPVPDLVESDKTRHLLAYAAVALPVALARPRAWGAPLLGVLVWSIGIELVQPFVGRTRSLFDFLANATGVGLGVLLAAGLRRVGRRPA